MNLIQKSNRWGLNNCYISEITVAELKFGAEKSQKVKTNRAVVSNLTDQLNILPIFSALDIYAQEKSRLQKKGSTIDDFDLLIGATAISADLTLVTNNIKHLNRLKNIKLQNWTQAE